LTGTHRGFLVPSSLVLTPLKGSPTIKTLYIDIETAPNVAHVWGLWNQNVSLAQLQESSRMLCFAAKWQDVKRVEYFSEFHNTREEMLTAAHALLTEADVLCHYNGKRFDVPTLNKEFVLAGMVPPAPYQQIDLLEVVKRRFRFPSNKLAYVANVLGIGGKVKHEGHEMWVKCLAGDPTAWGHMRRYNKQDTALLEDLHRVLLPWITNHPNQRLMSAESQCPNCGGDDLRREGHAYTLTGKFQRYQCRGCGAWSRDGRRVEGTDIRGAAA
jgi:DNA polymerase elongation subunit (family B)